MQMNTHLKNYIFGCFFLGGGGGGGDVFFRIY